MGRKTGEKRWRCDDGVRGTATLETLLCLGPLLLAFLSMTQLGLLLWARLLVSAAADRAVRAASVIASDEPKYYDGSPRGDLRRGSPRHRRIVSVVKQALLPLGSTLGERVQKRRTVEDAIAHARAKFDALSIALPELALVTIEDESSKQGWIDATATIQLQVRRLVPCRVPLGASLLCRESRTFAEDEAFVEDLVKTGLSQREVKTLLDSASRFYELRATARLPNQGAAYFKDPSR